MSKKSVLKAILMHLKEREKHKKGIVRDELAELKVNMRGAHYLYAEHLAGDIAYDAGYLDCIRDLRNWIKELMETEGGN